MTTVSEAADALRNLHNAGEVFSAKMREITRGVLAEHAPLDERVIQKIVASMPGGLSGYLKTWGWLDFARALEAQHGIGSGVAVRNLEPATSCRQILEIIERVENRCMAVDGPVTPTTQEITEQELRAIYVAARRGLGLKTR